MTDELRNLAQRYTAAWNSRNAASVASCYLPDGSLTVNDGPPAVGREAITAVAQQFMTALPDMRLFMDGLSEQEGRAIFRWTLAGANTGPGGTGKRIRISGFEEWRVSADGLVAESRGHFDSAEYQRQLERGVDASR
jgi:nuclear transport factor 2 (NTF2) superfamily protein